MHISCRDRVICQQSLASRLDSSKIASYNLEGSKQDSAIGLYVRRCCVIKPLWNAAWNVISDDEVYSKKTQLSLTTLPARCLRKRCAVSVFDFQLTFNSNVTLSILQQLLIARQSAVSAVRQYGWLSTAWLLVEIGLQRLVENRDYFTSHVYLKPSSGVILSDFRNGVKSQKTRMMRLSEDERILKTSFVTDERIDGQTDSLRRTV